MNRLVATLIPLTLLLPSLLIAAELPGGDEIAKRINARNEGVAVSRKLTMQMTDRTGKTRIRDTRAFRKYFGDEKRTVIFYQQPKSVKGTAFLTWDYPRTEQDDDQWLYLPAMRKVRRISAADRGDYFLGTDLSYEDIKLESRIGIDDYRRKTLGENEVDGHHCYILESLPVDAATAKELGYGKIEQCVDSKIWIVRKAKMWDVNMNPLKTVYFSDIREVQGIWTQHRIEVENHKTGHRTSFRFSDVDYQGGVRDELFTQNALRRGL